MIGNLFFPTQFIRPRGRTLALVALGAPTYLSAEATAADPVMTGAIILVALFMFGTFVLTRWKMMLFTAPIWLLLMAQGPLNAQRAAPADSPSNMTAPQLTDASQTTEPRPISRPLR